MKRFIEFFSKKLFKNEDSDSSFFEGDTFEKILEAFSKPADTFIVVYDSSTFTDLAQKYIPGYFDTIKNLLMPDVELIILEKKLFEKNPYKKIRRIIKILLGDNNTQVVLITSSIFYDGGPQPMELFKEFKDEHFTYIECSINPSEMLPEGALYVEKNDLDEIISVLQELKLLRVP